MGANCRKEVAMDAPIWIMGANVALVLIDKVRRIAYDQIPLLGSWDVFEIVRLVDRDALAEIVDANSVSARCDRRRIDVGKAKGFAKPVAKHRKTDEGRSATPFESAPLLRHPARLKKRDEFLTKFGSAAV